MANNTLNFLSGFGEGFLKTLQSERERKLQEQQFNQKMAFEMRQMNLLDAYRQKQVEMQMQDQAMDREKTEFNIRSGYNEIAPEPNMPLLPFMMGGQGGGQLNKPFDGVMNPFDPNKIYAPKMEPEKSNLEGSYKNPKTGTYWKYDETKREGVDTGIPYDQSEGRNTTNINMNTPTEPYIETKDLDDAWETYKTLQDYDKNWQNLENKPKDKDGNVLSYDQIKAMKNKAMTSIERLTKDRSKKISEEYTGFNAIFNDLLRDPDYRNATDKDAFISKRMAGFPEEAIRLMKDLVSKRIF